MMIQIGGYGLEDAEVEHLNLLVDFSLMRGPDIELNFTQVFYFGEQLLHEQSVLVGEEYKRLFDLDSYYIEDYMDDDEIDSLIGWKIKGDDSGPTYLLTDSITIPEGGLELVAVLDDDD